MSEQGGGYCPHCGFNGPTAVLVKDRTGAFARWCSRCVEEDSFICDACLNRFSEEHQVILDDGATQCCKPCAKVQIDAADAKSAINYFRDLVEWWEGNLEDERELDQSDEDTVLRLQEQIGNLENAIRLLKTFLITDS